MGMREQPHMDDPVSPPTGPEKQEPETPEGRHVYEVARRWDRGEQDRGFLQVLDDAEARGRVAPEVAAELRWLLRESWRALAGDLLRAVAPDLERQRLDLTPATNAGLLAVLNGLLDVVGLVRTSYQEMQAMQTHQAARGALNQPPGMAPKPSISH